MERTTHPPTTFGRQRVRRRRALAACVASALAFGACGSDKTAEPEDQGTSPTAETVESTTRDAGTPDTEAPDTTTPDTQAVDTTTLDTSESTEPSEPVDESAQTIPAPTTTPAPTSAPTTQVSSTPDTASPTTVTSAAPDATTAEQRPSTVASDTMEDLIATARAVYGESTDAVGAIGAFLPVPSGIPTPEGAFVFDFAARIDPSIDDTLVIAGDVAFQAPGTLDDLITFYETSMTASGFELVGSRTDKTFQDEPLKALEFAIPGSDWGGNKVEVTVIDAASARLVEILIWDRPDQAATRAAQQRLGGWAQSFPGRGEDVSDHQVSISVLTVSSPVMVLGNSGYGTLPPQDQQAAILAALPGSAYALDDAVPPEDGRLTLTREGFDEVTVYVGDGGSLGTSVNIRAQLDL